LPPSGDRPSGARGAKVGQAVSPAQDRPEGPFHEDAGRRLESGRIPSSTAQSLSSPMFAAGDAFGHRFAAYAPHLQQLISQKWNTSEIDSRLRTASPVIVHFTILRDGTIKGVRIHRSSGNLAIDLSAQRAIMDVGRAPELPAAYERNEAQIEF